MKPNELSELVDRAAQLDRDIAEQRAELADLKKQIEDAAEDALDEECRPTDGGGWSWCANGERYTALVTHSGPVLVTSLSAAKKIEKLRELSGKAFRALFVRPESYKPIPQIRGALDELVESEQLPKGAVRGILKLITGPGRVSLRFQTKEEVAK